MNIIDWMILLICSSPPLPPNGFVNLFVFGEDEEESAAWKGAALRACGARDGSRDYIGGALPPPRTPPFFCSGIFGGAVLGSFWVDFGSRMCPIRQLLDDYVNLFRGFFDNNTVLYFNKVIYCIH